MNNRRVRVDGIATECNDMELEEKMLEECPIIKRLFQWLRPCIMQYLKLKFWNVNGHKKDTPYGVSFLLAL